IIDRRNVLIGLGGLTGAAAGLQSSLFAASAAPVPPPDFTKCDHHPKKGLPPRLDCCPPLPSAVRPFPQSIEWDNIPKFRPTEPRVRRVRQPAHAVKQDYINKYSEAVRRMRALKDDDPISFVQQANVHCAYCEGFYKEFPRFKDTELQVHFSWLFFPFHRWYLYFYEKILGKLIGDPSFALPFWNWDAPEGMQMPNIYTDNIRSPLYDEKRSKKHQPPKIAILNYNEKSDEDTPTDVQIEANLSIMSKQMGANGKTAEQFFGCPLRAGEAPEPGAGSIENIPHNSIHNWTGTELNLGLNGEDMGQFYSAGRDPIFFAHHSNVDRMWYLRKTLGIIRGRREGFTDPDWLNSEFLFYDENRQLVRVNVHDSLDTRPLGYVYEDVPIPWQGARELAKARSRDLGKNRQSSSSSSGGGDGRPDLAYDRFPLVLDGIKKVVLERPKGKLRRSKAEKEEEEELLALSGIEFDRNVRVSFDVFVTDLEDDCGPKEDCTPKNDNGQQVVFAEYAGSFVNVPQVTVSERSKKTCLRLGLTDLLEDICAEDRERLVVTFKPTYKVTQKNAVKIQSGDVEFAS
ncbi:Polyphenol oxidase, partial [Parasponia andersonii]